MKEVSALLAVALALFALSACGAAREASAPDDRAIAERVSAKLQRMTVETSVSVQAERHGNRLDYTIQGDADKERTLVLAAWYDTGGRMLGVSRGESGTISVEDGAHMYRVFLLDAVSYEPLCRAWNSETDSRPASVPQTGWTTAVPAAYRYYAVGTLDSVKSQTLMQAEEMLARGDTFTPDHYVFYQKDGGYHDMNAVQEYLYNALPLFFSGGKTPVAASEPVTERTTVGEVKGLPAFENFGRLLFPVDRNVPDSYTLADVSSNSVYTWYSNIHAEKTAEIVNYLKEQAENGKRVFYPIYSEEEMNADASKRDAGLFFFRGNDGGPFAVCNAGGGFVYVGAMHDSFPHALELSKKGYNAFALIYRPDCAYEDLGQALCFIHDHAEALGVNPDGYSLWGGSAGARMAATLGNADGLRRYTGRADIPQAAAVVMQYTGYSSVSRADAPTYANCGKSDGIAGWRAMESRLNTLSGYGIPTEFHAYESLSHGFGLGTDTVAEGWIDAAAAFWQARTG